MKFYRLFLVLVAAPLSLLWLVASTAQATDVNLAFLPAGTKTPAAGGASITSPSVTCSGGTPGTRPGTIVNGVCDDVIAGDILVFGVDFQVDGAGLNAWSVDLDWDTGLQNSLTLDAVTPVATFYRGFANPSPPPAVIGYTVQATGASQQSSPTQGGYVHTVSGGLTQDFGLTIANTSFRAGTVTFNVNGTAETQLSLGFFRTDGASMGDSASQFITPSFGVFQIGSVPGTRHQPAHGRGPIRSLDCRPLEPHPTQRRFGPSGSPRPAQTPPISAQPVDDPRLWIGFYSVQGRVLSGPYSDPPSRLPGPPVPECPRPHTSSELAASARTRTEGSREQPIPGVRAREHGRHLLRKPSRPCRGEPP